MNKCMILKTELDIFKMDDFINYIADNLENLRGEYICVCNVHTVVMGYEDDYYNKIQKEACLRITDGMPLVYVAKKRGFKQAERIAGPDLMNEIFNISEKNGITHYFYGSTPDTIKKLKVNLLNKYPNLKIVGGYSPPFRELSKDEDEKIIKEINKLSPDILWVGLGAPKQEMWMYNHKDKINSLMIGVGAGFDYFAGNIKRAPMWMQKMSLEWLYRLIQDPKRLWRRYVVYNGKFILYMIKIFV